MGRTGRWAPTATGFLLTQQQDELFSCPDAPSLMQTFGYQHVAELHGLVTGTVSGGELTVTAVSTGGDPITLRFADGGRAGIPPPMVAPDTGGTPVAPPSGAAGGTPPPATSATATTATTTGRRWVGIRWRLIRIDHAGYATSVPAAADEWLELNRNLTAVAKFNSCRQVTANWMPTTTGVLIEVFRASEWPCPWKGGPVVSAFAATEPSQIAAVGVVAAGSRLTVTFGSETLLFIDSGPAKGARS